MRPELGGRGVRIDEDSSPDPAVRDAAERAGYKALLAGSGLAGNPYRWSTHRAECIAWGRGWAAARTDLTRANNKAARE